MMMSSTTCTCRKRDREIERGGEAVVRYYYHFLHVYM